MEVTLQVEIYILKLKTIYFILAFSLLKLNESPVSKLGRFSTHFGCLSSLNSETLELEVSSHCDIKIQARFFSKVAGISFLNE